jgi:hypothetical protein
MFGWFNKLFYSPSKFSLSTFLIAVLSFIICWSFFLTWGERAALKRAAVSFDRPPEAIRELGYPLWLLEQSRVIRPSSKKLVLLGDSTVYGTSSSSSRNTIGGTLAASLEPLNVQVFSLCLPNLGPTDYEKILKHIQPDDYVIIELASMTSMLNIPSQLTQEKLLPPQNATLPLFLAKSEIAMRYGKTPALIPFNTLKGIKTILKTKVSGSNVIDEQFQSFLMDKRYQDKEYYAQLIKRLNEPLNDQSIKVIKKILEVRKDSRSKTLFYITPVNPVISAHMDMYHPSIFHKNLHTITQLLSYKPFSTSYIDYSLSSYLEPSDFHDLLHLTDSGCVKLGKNLSENWVSINQIQKP